MEQQKKLLKLIDQSLTDFLDDLPAIEKNTYARLLELLKELELERGTIKNSLNNLRLIPKIKSEVDKIVMNPKYMGRVSEFAKTYGAIATLQNEYFASISTKFTPKKIYKELKNVSIQMAVEGLTESGIGVEMSNEITQVLRQNITEGGSYADLSESLRNKVIGEGKEPGIVTRYSKQITYDSINQFNRNYVKVISDDLGLDWYAYTGSLKTTSRPFCKELSDRGYFHRDEIPDLLRGKIGDKTVPLNEDTGLPEGMIEGTNESNFITRAGGYNCGHIIFPVSEAIVPKKLLELA